MEQGGADVGLPVSRVPFLSQRKGDERARGGGPEAGADLRHSNHEGHETLNYGRSTASATPLPPPRHSVAIPRFRFLCLSAYSSVVSTRAPLAPIGWPSATAPPLTFTLLPSTPSSRRTATACTANASCNSMRSTSSSVHPIFLSSRRTASTGVISTYFGASPLVAWPTIRAIGVTLRCRARSADITTTAAAPSFTGGALPAVTVPSFLNAALRAPSVSMLASARTD